MPWFHHFGSYYSQARGPIPRFRCLACGKTFSTQTFSIHYWTHSDVDLKLLDDSLYACSGYRQISRDLNLSLPVLVNRYMRITRGYLNLYDTALSTSSLSESLAFDGFESFTRSQYFPNNFNILVGQESQSVYMLNLSIMRRKGRMTDIQKANRALIDTVWRPRRKALVKDCLSLFHDVARLILRQDKISSRTLETDMKREYITALKEDRLIETLRTHQLFFHHQTDSRANRTLTNPLMAVNYIDREIRKNSAAHVRETVRQDREVNMALARMIITLGHHTFRKPYRITNVLPIDGCRTHAEVAGLMNSSEAKSAYTKLYSHRHFWSHQLLKSDWMERAWLMEMENPKRLNLNTGEVAEKYQPGTAWKARHFVV